MINVKLNLREKHTPYERKHDLKQSKDKLRSHLSNLLQHINRKFLAVDQANARYSVVDEFFGQFNDALTNRVDELVAQKEIEYQSELSRLEAAILMTEEERKEQAAELKSQVNELKALGHGLEKTAKMVSWHALLPSMSVSRLSQTTLSLVGKPCSLQVICTTRPRQ